MFDDLMDGHPDKPEGWKYVDFPMLDVDLWRGMISAIGENNIKLLTFARYERPNGSVAMRGQSFLSPQGVDNMKQWAINTLSEMRDEDTN